MRYNETTTKGKIVPENNLASAFAQEVAWTVGIVAVAALTIYSAKVVGRRIRKLKKS
jgi:hypothetical protein